MNDPIASLIARLLAERWLSRDDAAVRELLTDAELRNDLDRRLASVGMRLLEHPYAAHIAVGIARPQESAVFGSAKAWSSTNLQLDRDAVALLVVLWALLVLPKRQRQIARQKADRDQDQEQMFAELKPVPVGAEVVEPINERTLMADFGEKLGGKTRIQFNLGSLARQGFIVRRKERIHEGPMLDLAFDYERIAGRVMDGALSFVVAEARQHALEMAEREAADALLESESERATAAELADAALAAAGLQADDYDAFQAAIEAVESVVAADVDADEALPEAVAAETDAVADDGADAAHADASENETADAGGAAADEPAPQDDPVPPEDMKHEEAAADV
ncbi:hypothetical protein GLE_1295 [Lysobacter enzymogenes]|uniref:Uncharacterized protein n=1 Tax=Lysobacter enzymogenes TaxID=69 RepID=A0A0S2DDL3_LYSEN|nr:hypothetical protein [Lysobacter enzymogenes]ALN56652.1 hypothetical protein GLE_1295 [Lysobacter enzymogenes]QCW25445.1 hypothetical protein FE772_06970 [Lysobacter enzymogenes]